jgi:hypothetical protein
MTTYPSGSLGDKKPALEVRFLTVVLIYTIPSNESRYICMRLRRYFLTLRMFPTWRYILFRLRRNRLSGSGQIKNLCRV